MFRGSGKISRPLFRCPPLLDPSALRLPLLARKPLFLRFAFAPKLKPATPLSPPVSLTLCLLRIQLILLISSSSKTWSLSFFSGSVWNESVWNYSPWFGRCTAGAEWLQPPSSASGLQPQSPRRVFGDKKIFGCMLLRSDSSGNHIPPVPPALLSFAGHSNRDAALRDSVMARRLRQNDGRPRQAANCRGHRNRFRCHQRR